MDIVVGTAGHIDHGKTALVKALTGVDADRLPEEKRRGITIDLGFAELDLGNVHVGFVDVPGHERFVKNMLAGASGIDLVMLVVAADEGVMPQTREHFDICRLLGTKAGLIALTKADLGDRETIDLARLDIAELVKGTFLEKAPVIAVSSKTGDGIDELKRSLSASAGLVPARRDDSIARIPIDRVFTMKGFGAVVTGTVASGAIAVGDEMDLLPAGRAVRVRGLQTHGRVVSSATSGRRTAVNLGGIDHAEIARGMTLAEPNVLRPTQVFDASVEVVAGPRRSMKSRQRVRVHIGTAEVLARVRVLNETGEIEAGDTDFIQVRLESGIVGTTGDRFIIRSYSPQQTIAGGKILDPFAARHKRREFVGVRAFLSNLERSSDDGDELVARFIAYSGERGLSFAELQSRTALRREVLQSILNASESRVARAEDVYLSAERFSELKTKTLGAIEAHHAREPLLKGISRERLSETVFKRSRAEIFKSVVTALESEKSIVSLGDTVALAGRQKRLNADEELYLANLKTILTEAGLEVAKSDEVLIAALRGTRLNRDQARKLLQISLDSGDVAKVSDEFLFAKPIVDDLVVKLQRFAEQSADRLIDVPKFKEIAGVSRKYAIPLLEYFDREKITIRSGDKRIIR